MKKLLLTFLLATAGLSCWATDYYLVGDGTTIGWTTGTGNRAPTKMTETSISGVYVWTGPLKHASEGFYICDGPSVWSGYGSSVDKANGSYAISETGGTDNCKQTDNKWNPTNTDWQYYTITLNTNNSTMSWASVGAADGDGYYSIGNAATLYCFSSVVNQYDTSAKAKLTADINYSAYPQGFIGTSSNKFAGTFDGQGHTISLALVSDAAIRGLFAFINNATIRNLIVDGSITSSFKNIGGLGGQINGSSTVENVLVKTTLNYSGTGSDASAGGIFPYVDTGSSLILRNCAFVGSIKVGTAQGNAGLVSWNSGSLQATNCLIAPAEVVANEYKDYTRGNAASATNCYSVSSTDARLASGELCYLLNGSTCYNPNWTQTIGTDNLPVPFTTQGIVNKIPSAGYATQFIPTTDVTIPAGVEAFAGVVNADRLRLIPISGKIKQGEPVVLKGSEGFYSFVPTTGASAAASNSLSGSDGTASGTGIYALSDQDGVGFFPVDSGIAIPAGKAYLSDGAGVKGFTFLFDDDATGIDDVNGQWSMVNGQSIHNVAGQRMSKMHKGINILNGKKVLK